MQQLPFRKEAVAEFCTRLVRPLTVASDGLSCFTAAADAGVHDRIVTGGGRASANAKHPEFQAVNIMLGNLETAIAGTHHAIRFAKSATRYLAGFQYRLTRRYRMKKMLPAMLRAILAAPPCPLAAVRTPEVPC